MRGASRREFLKSAAVAAGGLVVVASLQGCAEEPLPVTDAAFVPNQWVRVGDDGAVTVRYGVAELGQGTSTGLAMLVAEELDVPWTAVRVEAAPAHEAFNNPLYRAQLTGGSTGLRGGWQSLREAGAKARLMLIGAAAARWKVPAAECTTSAGFVVHAKSERRVAYANVAADAALQSVPAEVTLKSAADFQLLGTSPPRKDLADKVTGRARFGIDVREPGMLAAVVARPPSFAGRVRKADDAAARAVPGVRHVVRLDTGIGVVADTTWQALEGRRRLAVEWEDGPDAALDSEGIRSAMGALLDAPGDAREARRDGDPVATLAEAKRRITADYDVPYLAHMTMEPMNCAAHAQRDRCIVWAPTQYPQGPSFIAGGGVRGVAAKALGLAPTQVEVRSMLCGGGFGRRVETDMVADAVLLSRAVGAPVRVTWTREDDLRHDFYRPASRHRLAAALDVDGAPTAWTHHVASPSIMARMIPGFVPDWAAQLGGPLKGGVDSAAVEGARELPYAIPNVHVGYSRLDAGVPIGFWRSVGHSTNAFVVESFVDELALAAGGDPVAFRRTLLRNAPRHLRVLNAVAEHSAWGTPLPDGVARGVAVWESFESVVGVVAEVSLREGRPRVRRLVAAADCGFVVHADAVRAQIEGGMLFGLSAALGEQVTIARGGAVQTSYADYPMLRMDVAPAVEVVLVPGGSEPGGAGEPGVPPAAPAVANALAALTGRRARALPLATMRWA